jgi:hypothetical protein
MRRSWSPGLLLVIALAGWVAGCGGSLDVRLRFPALSGMDRVSASLWVEPGMPAAMRADLAQEIVVARARIDRFYGLAQSSPTVFACVTQAKARALGLRGRNRAHTVAGRMIVLGPRGLVTPVLVHEWAHAELDARLAPGVLHRVPRWFDEGLSSVVGDEPWHSEANWQEIVRRGLPVPHMNELYTFRQMSDAVREYGDSRSDSTGNMHVVYSAAAHEVRGWLARAGRDGLPRLISGLNGGEAFGPAYLRIGGPAPEEP